MVLFRNIPVIRRFFAKADDGKPPFPTQQLFILGESVNKYVGQ